MIHYCSFCCCRTKTDCRSFYSCRRDLQTDSRASYGPLQSLTPFFAACICFPSTFGLSAPNNPAQSMSVASLAHWKQNRQYNLDLLCKKLLTCSRFVADLDVLFFLPLFDWRPHSTALWSKTNLIRWCLRLKPHRGQNSRLCPSLLVRSAAQIVDVFDLLLSPSPRHFLQEFLNLAPGWASRASSLNHSVLVQGYTQRLLISFLPLWKQWRPD